MPRFNSPTMGQRTTNMEGAPAYKQSPKLEIVQHVLTSFVQDSFYRTADAGLARLRELVAQNDPVFVAKLAVYARTVFHLRSVSHVLAAELAKTVRGGTTAVKAGEPNWLVPFLAAVVVRPDDATEIMALHLAELGRPTNAVKKGLGRALLPFDEYSIAKYKAEGKKVSLVDVVNLCHPRTLGEDHPLAKLVKGTLEAPETWEVKLTQAGQVEGTDEERAEAKNQAWREMAQSGKLGIFAAVRNIRNILEADESLAVELCDIITDEDRVRRSKMYPFRFYVAAHELRKSYGPKYASVIRALDEAMGIATKNLPELPGKTLVAVDCSASMHSRLSDRSGIQMSEIAAIFAAVLARTGADVVSYANDVRAVDVEGMSVIRAAEAISASNDGGTNTPLVVAWASAHAARWDRIIILTDEQSWMEHRYGLRNAALPAEWQRYVTGRPGARLYLWDLRGYGTMKMPEGSVTTLAGWSERTIEIIARLEEDKDALIREIDAVNF